MIFLIILSIFISGCSSFQWPILSSDNEQEKILSDYQAFESRDYIDHMKSFEKTYVNNISPEHIEKISGSSHQYLSSIIKKIEFNNELFFKSNESPQFYIIYEQTPFYFSLPGKVFFLSEGLVKKYIKNEVMLYCLLSFELVRSEKNIYEKKIIIPSGVLSTQQMIALNRISTADKVEVHKWAFYVLKRVGIEPESYLAWLQVINRNSLDFSLQLGDIHSISKEEAMFKAFLIQNEKRDQINRHHGSSREFYKFVKNLKG